MDIQAEDILAVGDFSLSPEAITPFINTAKVIVSNNLEGKGLSDDTLEQIAIYLSAHFTALKDPQVSQSKVLDSSYKYEGKTEMGFKFTRFGQMAITLDTSNTLDKLQKPPKKASIKSI